MKTAGLRIDPLRYAFICAALYGLVAALWIEYSTNLAQYFARTLEQFTQIEVYKGFAFVAVTSVGFFLFSYSVFRKMAASARMIIKSQQRLVQAEREALTGILTSSIAHDFNNLLTVLRLQSERLRSQRDLTDNVRASAEKIDRTIDRLAELTQRMRQAGRQFFGENPHSYDLSQTILETIEFLKGHILLQGCELEVDIDSEMSACGYSILIHQLVMNLILNAAEATAGHGHILLRARREGSATRIEVHDNGPGIPPQERERIFEAFRSTKRRGSGLGLVSVRSCVEIHNGSLQVGESSLGGAQFTVVLPDLDESRVKQLKMPESLGKVPGVGKPLPV
jgi:two-component system sensor histidine kinase HydH